MPLDCKIIYYEGGSMIVGCGSQPCKCGQFASDHEELLAEIEANLVASDDGRPENESLADAVLRRRRVVMPDYDERLKRWLS